MKISFGLLAATSSLALISAACLPLSHPLALSTLAFAEEDDFEDEIEEDIEEEIDEDIEDEIDDELEDEIEDAFEEEIEDEVEDAFEDEFDEAFEDEIEDEFEDAFEEDFEETIEDDLDEEFEEEVDDEGFEDRIDEMLDEEVLEAFEREEVLEELELSEFEDDGEDWDEDEEEWEEDEEDWEDDEDEEDWEEDWDEDEIEATLLDDVDFEIDEDGDLFTANEVLILSTPQDIDALIASGLEADNVSDLENLDLKLVRVPTFGSRDFDTVQDLVDNVAPNAEIDVNNIYLEQSVPDAMSPSSEAQNSAVPISVAPDLKIGLIDTAIDTRHPVFQASKIIQRDFVTVKRPRSERHGTAVASILVGSAEDYTGLVPNADIYAASVFFQTTSGASSATTESLVAALDWLVESQVDVINMSLSGPPNIILERAVARVEQNGILLVAAVGNAGPVAKPRYPSGYKGVVGVTAVSPSKKVFRLAGRGAHVDFSAPGVGVKHADAGGGFTASAGTSFAAPFVTAILALESTSPNAADLLEALVDNAEDLGPVGFDPIYGHGLIKQLAKQVRGPESR